MIQVPERWYAKIICGIANPFTLARELYTAEAALAEARKERNAAIECSARCNAAYDAMRNELKRVEGFLDAERNNHRASIMQWAKDETTVTQQAATIAQLREMVEAACCLGDMQEFLAAATVIRYRATLASI